jgi:hypothetical protein
MNTVNPDNFNETMQGYFNYAIDFAKEQISLDERTEEVLRSGLTWAKDCMTMEDARNYKKK